MCIFCKISKGDIPSYKVYEDDKYLAFLDISQTTKGHTLLIPKKHFENLLELDTTEYNNMFDIVKKIAKGIKDETNAKGFNILNNCNEAAGQTVMHFHIHIIPRYDNDNFNISFSSNPLCNDEFISLANSIKSKIQ